MNTNRLVSEYEHIYKNFFNKYDIVISSPIVATLVWDISVFSKWDTSILTQKITLRNYIWYNFNSNLNEIEYIVRDNDKWFISQSIESKYPITKKLLNIIWLDGSVWFLSEYNSANPPSIISNILMLKLLVDKQINIEDFEKFDLDNKDYKELLNKVLELDSNLLEKFNFFGWLRNNSLYLWTTLLASDSHILAIQNNNKYIYKNIWNFSDFNQLDLTFSLISPNLVIKNNYNSTFLDDKTKKLSWFINEFWIDWKYEKDVDLFKWMNNIWNFYSIKIFQDLLRLYKSNYSWNNFYRDLKIYRETIKSLFNNKKDELNDRFIKKQILELIPDKNFDFYMDYFGVFSSIKFALFNQKTWYIDEELINKLNKKTGFNLKLDYSSFYDWYERNGIKLEQYRSLWEVSMFSSNYMLFIYKNGFIDNISWDYSDFAWKKSSWLTLDLIKRKIYLDWEKLTSKQIHSQNTTIDILEILLSRLGDDVSNSELPKSSYSTNKNEMLWKIVLPLLKIIEERKKIKMAFICKGSLSDFYMKLKPSELEINIIKKLS